MNQSSPKKTAASLLFLTIIFGVVAVWQYYDLTAFEENGGSIRVHSMVKLLYNMGGKWTVVGVMGGASVVSFLFALRNLFSKS